MKLGARAVHPEHGAGTVLAVGFNDGPDVFVHFPADNNEPAVRRFRDGAVYELEFPETCDWPECQESRERDFLFCTTHLGAEIDRWLTSPA